jgi:protease-4
MYADVTDEQREYLMEKLINPSYNRFVNLVAQGRQGLLTIDEVKKLADGSIYGAEEAMANKLIDDVGYFEKAVSTAEGLAGIKGARVVEYARQFSLSMLLGAEAKQKKLIEADRNMLHELATPQLMYLWDVRW